MGTGIPPPGEATPETETLVMEEDPETIQPTGTKIGMDPVQTGATNPRKPFIPRKRLGKKWCLALWN